MQCIRGFYCFKRCLLMTIEYNQNLGHKQHSRNFTPAPIVLYKYCSAHLLLAQHLIQLLKCPPIILQKILYRMLSRHENNYFQPHTVDLSIAAPISALPILRLFEQILFNESIHCGLFYIIFEFHN